MAGALQGAQAQRPNLF